MILGEYDYGMKIGTVLPIKKSKKYFYVTCVESNMLHGKKGSVILSMMEKDLTEGTRTFENVDYAAKTYTVTKVLRNPNLDEPEKENPYLYFDVKKGGVSGNAKKLFGNVKFVRPKEDDGGRISGGSITLGSLNLPFIVEDGAPYQAGFGVIRPQQVQLGYDRLKVRVDVGDSHLEGVKVEVLSAEEGVFVTKFFLVVRDRSGRGSDRGIDVIIDFNAGVVKVDGYFYGLMTASDAAASKLLGVVPHSKVNVFKSDSFLSNYYECLVEFDGRPYTSSEAAYQSMKFLDKGVRDRFSDLGPDDAKKYAKKLEAEGLQRADWHGVKRGVMHDVVSAKFTQNSDLKDLLLHDDKSAYVEDTTGWHDMVWGKCYCQGCRGRGANWLGEVLIEVKKELAK